MALTLSPRVRTQLTSEPVARIVTPTAVAAGHRDVAFCNTPCSRCEREMDRRSARHQRAQRIMLDRTMRTAPTGRA